MTTIRLAEPQDFEQLARMHVLLWPETTFQEELEAFESGLFDGTQPGLPAAVFVAEDDRGALIGFLEVGLRSHADGCDPLRPVGFVEGWYVHEAHRGKGVGGELLRAAEGWARAQGCLEMASDALIDNLRSHRVHQALGFEVVDRCVHFRKPL